MRSAAVVATLVCVLALPCASANQAAQSSLSGRVVSATDQRAVSSAAVILTSLTNPGITFSTKSDASGSFQFEAVPAGRYAIRASKTGWIGTFAALIPQYLGMPVTITAGETIRELSLRLTPSAVLAGKVYNDSGEPAPGIEVRVYQSLPSVGVQLAVGVGNTASLVTDDLGEYRVYDLPPGDYVIAAQPKASASEQQGSARGPGSTSAARLGYAPVYYPAAVDISAAGVVTLEPGTERLGLDLRMRLEPVWNITGTVRFPDELSRPSASITLIAAKNARIGLTRTVQAATDGRFDIRGVPAGRYVLYARARPDAEGPVQLSAREIARASYAREEIQVADDVHVDLTMRTGVTAEGSVAFHPAPQNQAELFKTVAVTLESLEDFTSLMVPTVVTSDSGGFFFPNVPPGRYRISASAPRLDSHPWYLSKVVNADGLEGAELVITAGEGVKGIQIHFNDDTGGLAGTLTSPSHSVPTDYLIIVFPEDRSKWGKAGPMSGFVRPKTSGRFELLGLPPGKYLLATLAAPGDLVLFTPAALSQAAPFGIKVEIKPGIVAVQDLRVPGMPTDQGIEAAGIDDFNWHDLRHTFASRLAMAGVGIRGIQEALGHKSISMTVRYAHLAPDFMADVVEKLVPESATTAPESTDTRTDTSNAASSTNDGETVH